MRDSSPTPMPGRLEGFDLAAAVRSIEHTGIVAVPGAFTPDWSAQLFHDLMRRADEARSTAGGTVSRGPDRVYFSVPPETLSGFVDIIEHPALTQLCETIVGPAWQVVEVGCDLPGPGAQNQPWHRDYSGSWDGSTLAVNIPGLVVPQVTPAMGPFQIAEGTHHLDGSSYRAGMFPSPELYESLEERSSRRFPKQGDMSVRSALTLHRGTRADPETASNPSMRRPVLVVGIVAPGVAAAGHRIFMTHRYFDSLQPECRDRIRVTHRCPTLPPIVEEYDIEGLLMGA
jgi:hypothetical protein